MALRLSFVAVVVPLLSIACGDSIRSPTSAGGSSPGGVTSGIAGTGGGAAKGASGAAGASVGGANPGLGGVGGLGGAHAGQSASGGQAGSVGGGAGLSVAGASGGSPSDAGNAGAASGVPTGWIVVTDVDYTKIPGPNFDTVRLMFEGVPCSGSSCHFGGRNHLQVDKAPDALYKYMMSFKTLECGKLIDTANPSASAIVKYLRGPCGKTERMPLDKCFEDGDEMCVPEYYIQAIEQWIALGAPR